MQLEGTLKLINDTQTFDSGFTKREVVLTTNEQYPQDIKVDFVKDKCAVLDSYKVGDAVNIGINIRGNEYNGKYYVNIQGWKIDKAGQAAPQEAPAPMTEEVEDDLPF